MAILHALVNQMQCDTSKLERGFAKVPETWKAIAAMIQAAFGPMLLKPKPNMSELELINTDNQRAAMIAAMIKEPLGQ